MHDVDVNPRTTNSECRLRPKVYAVCTQLIYINIIYYTCMHGMCSEWGPTLWTIIHEWPFQLGLGHQNEISQDRQSTSGGYRNLHGFMKNIWLRKKVSRLSDKASLMKEVAHSRLQSKSFASLILNNVYNNQSSKHCRNKSWLYIKYIIILWPKLTVLTSLIITIAWIANWEVHGCAHHMYTLSHTHIHSHTKLVLIASVYNYSISHLYIKPEEHWFMICHSSV